MSKKGENQLEEKNLIRQRTIEESIKIILPWMIEMSWDLARTQINLIMWQTLDLVRQKWEKSGHKVEGA